MPSHGTWLQLSLRFAKWGVLFSRRNLVRNLLAVASLALATGTLIAVGTLSEGKPATAHLRYRQFVGGDLLVVTSQPVVTDLQGLTGPLKWRDLAPGSHISSFTPLAAAGGTLHGRELNISEILEMLAAHKEVAAIYPYHGLPVLLETPGGPIEAVLRGRDPRLDREIGFDSIIVEGEYPENGDNQVLIDGFRWVGASSQGTKWVTLNQGMPEVRLYPTPEVGAFIDILIPRPGQSFEGGDLGVNFDDAREARLTVSGHYMVHTGDIDWRVQTLLLSGPAAAASGDFRPGSVEPLYWSSRELVVPLSLFLELLQSAGWETTPPVQQIGVILKDTTKLERVKSELEALIGADIVSVAEISSSEFGAPEPTFRVPMSDIILMRQFMKKPSSYVIDSEDTLVEQGAQGSIVRVPGWVKQTLVVLIYGLAAIMFLGNLYVLLLGRRAEIAVLQAVGATPGLVLITFGVEALILAMLGATVGWLAMAPLLMRHWGVTVGSAIAVSRSLQLGLKVVVLAMACSLIFGVVPVYSTIKRSPVEVLKDA